MIHVWSLGVEGAHTCAGHGIRVDLWGGSHTFVGHGTGVELEHIVGVSPHILLCLRQSLVCCSMCQAALLGASGDPPVPSSYLTAEALGYRHTLPCGDFMWILEIWTRVLVLTQPPFTHRAISCSCPLCGDGIEVSEGAAELQWHRRVTQCEMLASQLPSASSGG